MSASWMDVPHSIASLPSPLDATHGRTQAAPVYGLRGSRKRKRHEVSVAIDGEGVNTYNIQTQNLISSHAVPPQSYFDCAPCSIHTRPSASYPAWRQTYVVLRDGLNNRKRRLLCFSEELKGFSPVDVNTTAPQKTEYKLQACEVRNIEAIPNGTENPSIAVCYNDGGVEFFSGDLSRSHHESIPLIAEGNPAHLEYATFLDMSTARKGILQNREDVLATLDQSETRKRDALLCRVVRSDGGRQLHLYTFRDPTKHAIQTSRPAAQLLMSYKLPAIREKCRDFAFYELDPPSGTLYQLLRGKLNIYDLSSTAPKFVLDLGTTSAPVTSFARVSASSVLSVSKEMATLFETNFGSVQASIPLAQPSTVDSPSKKRKRDEGKCGPASFTVISTFVDVGLVVGLSENQIVALQFNDIARSRSGGAQLADVIAKGTTNSTYNAEKAEKAAKKWDNWTSKINALIENGQVQELEQLVASDLNLGRQRKPEESGAAEDQKVMIDGHVSIYEELWPLPELFDPNKLNRRRIFFLLGKIFDFGDSDEERVEVRIASWRLLEWLALTGFLSASHLQKALVPAMQEAGIQGAVIRPGDIMAAIRDVDDDFQLMQNLLSLPVRWEVEEVVEALRLLIQSFNPTEDTEEAPLALPALSQTNGDLDMVNGDADFHIESESKAAEHELDHAMNALSSGLEVRSDALRLIFDHLHNFPQSTITRTMRSMMSPEEIIFFIHVLRMELADGGWTSKYVDEDGDDEDEGLVNKMGGVEESAPSDHALKEIGDLLNCAVDAIGSSGWLVGQSGAALRTDELIDSLKAEVSAGLEGCYEATSLGVFLTDLEKYAASTHKRRVVEKGNVDGEDVMLPLGPTLEYPVAKGKSESKSKMAHAMEQRRNVGKYSFEHIRI